MNLSTLQPLLVNSFPEIRSYLLNEVDSTSSFLKQTYRKVKPEASICLALHQTAGYGQRGRNWFSDNKAWKFSLCLPIRLPIHQCNGLSSIVGLAVIRALHVELNQDLNIKWPNDVWNDEGKVGGILIESIKLEKNLSWLVIGIGINFSNHSNNSLPAGKEYEFSSVELNGHSEELLFISVLESIFSYVQQFEQNSFEIFVADFKKLDKFKDGQSVIVYDSDTPIKGVYRGVNKRGEVEIELGGKRKTYCSGLVSIRPN